jgi:hypothetical protein
MNRDGFSTAVRRVLGERVNFHCSNPTCRKGTVGPQFDPARSLDIGVAAHIAAAAPGGPRFDPSQTAAARKSANNGIWLCQNCAKLIDSDLLRHPVALLLRWKVIAERLALDNLGQGLFGLEDGPQPHTPVTRIFSQAVALPTDLALLFPSGLAAEAMASALLEDLNGFGQRLAVVGVKATNGDWRLSYFVRTESGWQSETEIDIPFQNHGRPSVTYIPGAPGALDIVHLTASGTGVLRVSHSIYRVGRGTNLLILSFPELFYVHGWGMPFRRELRLIHLQRPAALMHGAELQLVYEVNYTALNGFDDAGQLFSDQIQRRLIWDDTLQLFGPATSDDDFALLDEIWAEDTAGFLSRNHQRLSELNANGTLEQRAFVQTHLN